ncbi:MAG TPA: hypothetical protein DEB39_02605 [Planctomycetaceae bacterium]|nr:hypothetical protein [Planctomycetaceae bacterium]
MDGNDNVVLNWTDSASEGVTGYQVEWSADGNTWIPYTVIDPGVGRCVLGGLAEGNTYHFRIGAIGPDGVAPETAKARTVATIEFADPVETTLQAPVDLRYSNVTEDGLTVSWKSPPENKLITEYRITVYDKGLHMVASRKVSVSAEDDGSWSCAFDGLESDAHYTITVESSGGLGTAKSAPATTSARTALAVPTGFSGESVADQSVVLKWDIPDNVAGIAFHEIVYAVKGTDEMHALPLFVDPATGTCIVSGLDADTEYVFFLRAVGESGAVPSRHVTFEVKTTVAEPTDCVVADADEKSAGITWTVPTDTSGLAGYEIRYREKETGDWHVCANADVDADVNVDAHGGSSVMSVRVGHLDPGKEYQFQVRSLGREGSPSSNWIDAGSVTTKSVLDQPNAWNVSPGLAGNALDAVVRVTWTFATDAKNDKTGGYVIIYTPSGGEPVSHTVDGDKIVFDAEDGTYGYVLENLDPGTEYTFFLSVTGDETTVIPPALPERIVWTPLLVPVDLEAGNVTANSVQLTWNHADATGVDRYIVEYESAPGVWTEWTNVDFRPDGYACTVNGLDPGTACLFRVTAIGVAGVDGAASVTMQFPVTTDILTVTQPTISGLAPVAATGGTLDATLSWTFDPGMTNPAWVAGYTITYTWVDAFETEYDVEHVVDGNLVVFDAETGVFSYTLTTLLPGTAYTFTISAKGDGEHLLVSGDSATYYAEAG